MGVLFPRIIFFFLRPFGKFSNISGCIAGDMKNIDFDFFKEFVFVHFYECIQCNGCMMIVNTSDS